MKVKTFFLYSIMLFCLNSCTTYYTWWESSTFEPSQHRFEIDSAYLAKWGMESVEKRIRSKNADEWVIDSIPYFSFYLEREYILMPTILLVYWVEFQRSNALSHFKITIHNNKIYQSLDSISYTIYDSLEAKFYKGKYNYNKNIYGQKYLFWLETPYNIKIKLKKTDIVYADIDLFFTNYNNQPVIQSLRRIKFEYCKRRFFWCIFNI